MVSYRVEEILKEKAAAENLRIEVTAHFTYDLCHSVQRVWEKSFCFSPAEFLADNNSSGKEDLYYELADRRIGDGTVGEGTATSILEELVLKATRVCDSLSKDFRGVLTLIAYVDGGRSDPYFHIQRFGPAINLLSRWRLRERGVAEETCAICLHDFSVGAELAALPCGHKFHDGCIVEWLRRSHLCPFCRFALPFNSESESESEYESESESLDYDYHYA